LTRLNSKLKLLCEETHRNILLRIININIKLYLTNTQHTMSLSFPLHLPQQPVLPLPTESIEIKKTTRVLKRSRPPPKSAEHDDFTYSTSLSTIPSAIMSLSGSAISAEFNGWLVTVNANEEVVKTLCSNIAIFPKDTSMFTGGTPPPPYTILHKLSATSVQIPTSIYKLLFNSAGFPPPPPKNNAPSCGIIHDDISFIGTLGDTSSLPQAQAVNRIITKLETEYSTCLIAPTGSGKTVMCIAAAVTLLKTRKCVGIVCRGIGLVRQWHQRITSFCKNVRVGKIHQNTCDVKNKHFVIISIDSLSRGIDYDITELLDVWPGQRKPGRISPGSKYPIAVFNHIDIVVVDECHQVFAPTYIRALYLFKPTSLIFTTATPKREGELCKQLFWFAGEGIEIKRTWDNVLVYVTHFSENGHSEIFLKDGRLAVWIMLSKLIISYRRNKMIVTQIIACLCEKRHILVLSDRCKHLQLLFFMLQRFYTLSDIPADARFPRTASIMVRGMTEAEEADAYASRVIFATYPMFATYRDVVTLDTLFLTTPKTQIKQAVGRVLRPCPTKNNVKVFDIVDSFSDFFRGQWTRRHDFFIHPDRDTPYFDKEKSHFTIFENVVDYCITTDEDDKEVVNKNDYDIFEKTVEDDVEDDIE